MGSTVEKVEGLNERGIWPGQGGEADVLRKPYLKERTNLGIGWSPADIPTWRRVSCPQVGEAGVDEGLLERD